MNEPIQVYDGGIEPPDPVKDNLRRAMEIFHQEAMERAEGGAAQIAAAMKDNAFSTLSNINSRRVLDDFSKMVGFTP